MVIRRFLKKQFLKVFKAINLNQTSGLDDVCRRVLKYCVKQKTKTVASIASLFKPPWIYAKNFLILKTSAVLSFPKRGNATSLNDFSPVALTSLAMTCLEKIAKSNVLQQTELDRENFLDIPHSVFSPAHHTLVERPRVSGKSRLQRLINTCSRITSQQQLSL